MIHLRTFALLLILSAGAAHAQLPIPKLNSIFPAGAKQGTSVDCVLTGGDLQGATDLYFSHAGITAKSTGVNKFAVNIGKDVPVGPYDVRVVSPMGLSNFRAFIVSDWNEVVEKEPNNELDKAQTVMAPVVVHGKMDGSTDVDHFAFKATKGQRLLINCWARRIDSEMDATMRLYDAAGKELAYSGDYYGRDPLIDVVIPEDGVYTLRIWDFVYGGGNDYFYRVQIGDLPHLDAIVPAAVKPGQKSTVTLFGRNLPGGKPSDERIQGQPLEMATIEIDVPADPLHATSLRGGEAMRPAQTSLDGMAYRVVTPAGTSNPVFLGFTSDPIVLEKEPNNDQASAQRVSVPCDITGKFSPAGDVDVYAFSAKKGEKLVLETFGDRQSGGLIDPTLTGYDSKGKKLASFDDVGKNIGKIRFSTTTRDARWDFVAPADGEYFVQVRDSYYQQRGDGRFTYRLSIRQPQPDFRLIVVPASENQLDSAVARRGGHCYMDLLVFRNDGFDDPIRVEASDLPPGVTCDPVVVGTGLIVAPLVFRTSADAPIGHGAIKVVGKAKDLVREARGGGLAWPTTNTPGVARQTDSIVLAVREPGPFALTATAGRTALMPGDKVVIDVKLERAKDWSDTVQLSGYELPPGATIGLVTIAKNQSDAKVELVLTDKIKPGTYSFAIHGAGQVPRDYAGGGAKTTAKNANLRAVYSSNALTINIGPTASASK